MNASSYHIQSYRFRETRFSKRMYTVYTIFVLINNSICIILSLINIIYIYNNNLIHINWEIIKYIWEC